MEPVSELYQPLTFDMADPEDPQSKPIPNKFDEPRPKGGYEFVPPAGTIPKVLDKKENLKIYDEQGSRYKGETNSEGQRHGKGKLTYLDGTTYEGSWVNGYRQGFGVLCKKDGPIYKGFFDKDLKHGEGELHYPNGDIIKTSFEFDRKHGQGTVITQKGRKEYEALFWNDIELNTSEQNPECFDLMPLNLFICFCFISGLFLAWYLKDIKVDLVVVMIYIVNIIDTACSRTHSMLYKMISQQQLNQYIGRLRVRPPIILFKIQNYHNAQIPIRGSDGAVQYYDQRVDTQFVSDVYRFSEWEDLSPDYFDVQQIKPTLISKIQFNLVIQGTAQANQSFKCQEYTFKRTHFQDDFFDYQFERSVDGFEKELIVYHTQSGRKPWFANLMVYWAFSLMCLGWLHRIIIYVNYKNIRFDINKLIAK